MITNLLDEEAIFKVACQITSVQARAAYLSQVCGDSPTVLDRISALLRVHDEESRFLAAPPPGVAATVDTPAPAEALGTLIGPYKLLEQVGEGGMGVVYVAEQTEPVRRRVALKIIKPGMDTKQVIARFEAERQALAMMDHPNIARVLDAGTTEAGRPYFVMELVRGMPITEYCDKAKLIPRLRLELFTQVCQAVQHAHQKGIIHRDLKPSNVLVTLHDGVPVVKVIDFGVAKAIGQQLTERTVYTALTQLVGTPLYMSPEQAEMSGLDVDTRSDVYSLGVLLYELLTGQTPFDKERLKSVGLDEMRRIIREDEPLPPSRRLSTLGAAAISTASQHRGLDERRLNKVLSGELDWIVMKALEKDRSRRYESASALAADIQRYLSDEPVLACPPTAMYRLQKFARKHKAALTTAAAIAACLVLGTTVSAWQAVRATTAEAQAISNANQAQVKTKEATEQRDDAQRQRDEVRALNDKLQAAQAEQRSTLYAAHIILAQRAWDAGGVGRVQDLLAQHQPKPGQADLRGFEWHYLNRLCHFELLTLQHTGEVNSLTYSPDGKRLAASSKTKTGQDRKVVIVWDTETGKEVLAIRGESGWGVVFSPDGTRMVSGAVQGRQGESKIRDAQTGEELQTLKGGYNSTAFSPDGSRLATIGDDVKILDAQTGEVLHTLRGTGGSIVFSPDGKRIASAGDEVKVWDAQTGGELLTLKAYSWSPQSVAFSPDGKHLASVSVDTSVIVWDAHTGQEIHTLEQSGASGIAFSPDGKHLAGGSWRGIMRVWNLQTGQTVRTIKGGGSIVAYSPDGQRLASSVNDSVKIWDTQKDQEVSAHPIVHEQLSPDGKRNARALADKSIMIQDAATLQEIFSLKGHKVPIWTMAFSPDGTQLASGGGGKSDHSVSQRNPAELKIWDLQTGMELFNFPVANGTVRQVTFSPNGKQLASFSGPMTIPPELKVWDAVTGQELFSLQGHTTAGSNIAYSPDGKRLASSTKDEVKLWDTQNGKELFSYSGLPGGWPQPLTFSSDSRRLAAAGSAGVNVWDTETGQELLSLKGHASNVRGVAFSPNGTRMATSSNDQTVKLWDSKTGQELLTFQAEWPTKVAFSPNAHTLLVNTNRMVKIYDATPLPEKP